MGIAHRLGVLTLLGLSTTAHAEVDWSRGLVMANGVGIADRHAPNPATARGPARRAAEEAARRQLTAQLAALPLAAGGTLKSRLGDKANAERITRAVDRAIALSATLETDGSWRVTLGVPLEAIRLALDAPRELPAAGDPDLPIVIVEGVKQKPALGVTIGGLAAATLFAREVPAWAAAAPRVKATGGKAGAITLTEPRGGPSTLFVLLP
ncbi:MAG: hypothetical protein WKG01_18680 [Kofleriaceae bacterium]